MGKVDYQKFYRERLKLKVVKPKPGDPEGEFKSQCPFCGVEGRAVVYLTNGWLDCSGCGPSTLENICNQRKVKMPTDKPPVAEAKKPEPKKEPAVKDLKGQTVFDEKPETYQKKQAYKGKGTFEKAYDYKDETGKLRHQTVRLKNPKSFYQRRPYDKALDDKLGNYVKKGIVYNKKKKRIGKLPWVNSLIGIKLVLYRLPELLKSKPQPVLLPEGEKDVDNLIGKGFCSTCNPMGSLKWKASYNVWLAGRDIILIPDYDPKEKLVGDMHVARIGNSLTGTAKTIKVLKPKDAKGKRVADMSVWLAGSPDPKQLEKLIIKEAVDFEPSEPEPEARPEKIDEDKIKPRHLTLIPDLIHLCQDGEAVKYLLKNKGGNLYIKKELIRDTYYDNGEIKNRYIYTPKQDLPISFTTPEVIDLQGKVDFPDLLAEVMDFTTQRLEMPEPEHYLVLALWILHTYLIEKFRTTPIIYACGVKETGKARLGEILRELAFRGQVLTTPTEASIFRESEYLKPCLIIDEIKLAGFDANKEVACLVNNRYKRGVKVCRVSLDKQGEDQLTYYDCFGCTVITTTESIKPALRSRCLVFVMQRNLRAEVERELDYKKGQELRNKLTCFRAEFIDKDLPPYRQVARGRLNELLLPLYQILMLVRPEWEIDFKEIVKSLRGQRKVEESLTLEYDILQVIVDELGGKIGDLCILTQDIGKVINEGIGEKAKPISDRNIAFRCKRLGFETYRQGNKRGFRVDRELLKTLVERYEIELVEKPVK